LKVKTNTHRRAEEYLKTRCGRLKFEYQNLGWDFVCDNVRYLVLKGFKSKVVVPYLKLKEALNYRPKILICFEDIMYETDVDSVLESLLHDKKLLIAEMFGFRPVTLTLKTPPNWVTLKIPLPTEVYKKFLEKMRLRGKLPDEIIRDFVAY